jgi:Mg-chelatase subunit ChlD
MNFYHLIILDASGSMDCIRRQALSGCNETLQSIRSMQQKNADQRHYVSIVVFNSETPAKTLYDRMPVNNAKELTLSDYVPNACTPLYDAIGVSVNRLAGSIDKGDKQTCVLVTIITDGQENCSREFNHAQLKSLIEERKQQGWTFAFIGANIDEVKEAERIGIHNTLRFEQDEEGTGSMFDTLDRARANFCMSAAKCGSARSREHDFFEGA